MTALNSDYLIEARDVTRTYRAGESETHALNHLNIGIRQGEFACIVGRSGSGKSTLLNVLAGLEEISSGAIYIKGQRIDEMSDNDLVDFRREHIGFVFQSFNLLSQYTAVENVAVPLSFLNVPKKERRRRALEMLDLVGIADQAEHFPMQMSGGQQQRVAIARALISDPFLVFADEPTGNLDSQTSADIMVLLLEIFRRSGTTCVMVTHDLNMAQLADRTITMLDGAVVEMTVREERMELEQVRQYLREIEYTKIEG